MARDEWDHLSELLARSGSATDELLQVETSRLPAWIMRTGRRLTGVLAETSRLLEACLDAVWRLVPVWKSPWWGFRFFLHYLRAVASPSAWLYIAIAGAIIGFVSTYFTFRFLPSANYTKPLVIEDLLRSMGFALYRILVPILATILIAARCGAAVASDVGGKRYGRQMDALRTLGVEPKRYLLTGILYAFLLGTPWLLAISYASAAVTSLVVFTATHPVRGPWFWQLHFHRELVVPDQWLYAGSHIGCWPRPRRARRDCAHRLCARRAAQGLEPSGQSWRDVHDSVVHVIRAGGAFRIRLCGIRLEEIHGLSRQDRCN